MNSTIIATLTVFGGLAAIGMVYNLVTLFAWRAEQRRRRRGEIRIAARIHEPFCPTRLPCHCPIRPDGTGRKPELSCHLRETLYSATGVIGNQPIGLPFVTTIALAGLSIILLVDPVLDRSLLWGGLLPDAVRAAIPEWLKWLWIGLSLVLVVALGIASFFLPQMRISRQWLVLNDDGRISALGADFPVFDPRKPFTAQERIWSDHRGVLIRQDGKELALVIAPLPTVARIWKYDVRIIAPGRAYAVGLSIVTGPVERHLERHWRIPVHAA